MKLISIKTTLFLLLTFVNSYAKVPYWNISDVVIEGQIVSSRKISGVSADGSIDSYASLSKLKNELSDISNREVWMDIVKVTSTYKGKVKKGSMYPIFYERRPLSISTHYEVPILGKKVIGKEVGCRRVFFINNNENKERHLSWKIADIYVVEYEKLPEDFREFLKKLLSSPTEIPDPSKGE